MQVLLLLVVKHFSKHDAIQFKGKLMNQAWENKNDPILACLVQIWATKIFCEFYLY